MEPACPRFRGRPSPLLDPTPGCPGTEGMPQRRMLSAALVLAGAPFVGTVAATPAEGQVASVSLVHQGRAVPLQVTPELTRLGRTMALGLLATASRDVTRQMSDAEVDALGRRGTLLRVELARPEEVRLLRLGVRSRASRLAAYVPPDWDDRAYVFLGRSSWERIVLVDLPYPVRAELRALRSNASASR